MPGAATSCQALHLLKQVPFAHHAVLFEIMRQLSSGESDRLAHVYAAANLLKHADAPEAGHLSGLDTRVIRRVTMPYALCTCHGDVSFAVKHRFVVGRADVAIAHLDGTWKADFGDMIVPYTRTLSLRFYELSDRATYEMIDYEVDESLETTPSALFLAMQHRWLVPGRRHVFFMRTTRGALRTVFVERYPAGWGIASIACDDAYRYSKGMLVAAQRAHV